MELVWNPIVDSQPRGLFFSELVEKDAPAPSFQPPAGDPEGEAYGPWNPNLFTSYWTYRRGLLGPGGSTSKINVGDISQQNIGTETFGGNDLDTAYLFPAMQ